MTLPGLPGGVAKRCKCPTPGCTHGTRRDRPPVAKAGQHNVRQPLDAGWGTDQPETLRIIDD